MQDQFFIRLPLCLHSGNKLLLGTRTGQVGEAEGDERGEKRSVIFRDVGPADIQVVAGLGDFLVSGAAALANTTSGTFRDFPQVSFATGDLSDQS